MAILKGILTALTKKAVQMVTAWASDDMAEWMLIKGGEALVKSTNNTMDDEAFKALVAAYEKTKLPQTSK